MDSYSKRKILGHVFIVNDVQNNVNFDKLLKFNLGYKKLGCMITSLDYLECFCKDIFAMIRRLKPLNCFVTFTMGVNNWPTIIETLRKLNDQHVIENKNSKNDILLNVTELVKKQSCDMCTLLST